MCVCFHDKVRLRAKSGWAVYEIAFSAFAATSENMRLKLVQERAVWPEICLPISLPWSGTEICSSWYIFAQAFKFRSVLWFIYMHCIHKQIYHICIFRCACKRESLWKLMTFCFILIFKLLKYWFFILQYVFIYIFHFE